MNVDAERERFLVDAYTLLHTCREHFLVDYEDLTRKERAIGAEQRAALADEISAYMAALVAFGEKLDAMGVPR